MYRSYPQHKSCLKDLTVGRTPGEKNNLKQVIFDEVIVREYPRILGDNPAVGYGPPVTIGWKFHDEYSVAVSFYEHSRRKLRRTRRTKLSSAKRTKILLEAGYTLEEIGDAIWMANEIKAQRTDSFRGATDRKSALVFLNGAVETTGAALKATMDVLGVKAAAERGVTSIFGVRKKSSRALFDSMNAAKGGMNRIRPKLTRKFVAPPVGDTPTHDRRVRLIRGKMHTRRVSPMMHLPTHD